MNKIKRLILIFIDPAAIWADLPLLGVFALAVFYLSVNLPLNPFWRLP